MPILLPTFNKCIELGHHPKAFRTGCTVAIRKPNKLSYTVAAGYKPLALLSSMGKLLEAVIAAEVSKATEQHHLLLDTQMGARPGKSTYTALTLATELIHQGWKLDKSMIVSMLNLAGAFDKVVHERVIHGLQKRQIPVQIVPYISSFLSQRTTTIKYGEHISEEIQVTSRLIERPQMQGRENGQGK